VTGKKATETGTAAPAGDVSVTAAHSSSAESVTAGITRNT